jgi:hypothetical protein
MVMVILEDQMLLPQEKFMIDKLIVISFYAIPAIIMLLICFWITRK